MHLSARLLLMTVALSAVACADERTFDRHVEAPPGGRLKVNLDVGSATLVGTNAHEVTVRARMWGDEETLSRIAIQVDGDTSGVQVRGHHGRDHFLSWFTGGTHVQFTIEVPKDYPVEIRTAGGSLHLEGLHASLQGTTAGGSVRLQDIQGTIDVRTRGGSITAERIEGPAKLITSGGSIGVRDAHGDIEARTVGGSITFTAVDGALLGHTSGGSVTADELGDHDVSLQTAGGSIHLRMPATAHASFDAGTVGGSVRSGLPITVTESAGRSVLRGSLNGAGHVVRLRTVGGSIHIEPQA